MSIYWPLGLFGVAAVGGLYMAVRVLTHEPPPWAVSVLHAVLAAAGLLCLFIVLRGAESLPVAPLMAALACLIAAAFAGFYLASCHARGKAHPRIGVGIHALAAVTGFSILVGVAFDFF